MILKKEINFKVGDMIMPDLSSSDNKTYWNNVNPNDTFIIHKVENVEGETFLSWDATNQNRVCFSRRAILVTNDVSLKHVIQSVVKSLKEVK